MGEGMSQKVYTYHYYATRLKGDIETHIDGILRTNCKILNYDNYNELKDTINKDVIKGDQGDDINLVIRSLTLLGY